MAIYEVQGRGTETNRKRSRVYIADSDADAREQATNDGTTVESIHRVLAKTFTEDIAGVSHKNFDNTSRQRIVLECNQGESLLLEHEQGNKHDDNAVRVIRRNGEQVGYLPESLAANVIKNWRVGDDLPQYAIVVKELYQNTEGSALRIMAQGVLVLPDTTETQAEEYLRKKGGLDDGTRWLLSRLSRLTSKPRPKREIKKKPEPQSGCASVILLSLIVAATSFLVLL